MKIIKKITIIFIVIILLMGNFKNVKAHDVELDPDGLIYIPLGIDENGEGLDVDYEGEYTLYYQINILSQEELTPIMEYIETIKDDLQSAQNELKTLIAEIEKERIEIQNEKDEYKKMNESNLSEINESNLSEMNEVYNAIMQREQDLMNKEMEAYEKRNEYSKLFFQYENEAKKLAPKYDENAWKIAENNKYEIDFDLNKNNTCITLWVKLVTTESTVYDLGLYIYKSPTDIQADTLKLDKKVVKLTEGENQKISVTILPNNATNKTVKWIIKDTNIAEIENGVIIAKAPGKTTLTVQSQDGKLLDTCEITVLEKTVEQVESKDITVVNTNLPRTGSLTYFIFIGIAVVGCISYSLYRKCKKYN